jgi:hypothetical protein
MKVGRCKGGGIEREFLKEFDSEKIEKWIEVREE